MKKNKTRFRSSLSPPPPPRKKNAAISRFVCSYGFPVFDLLDTDRGRHARFNQLFLCIYRKEHNNSNDVIKTDSLENETFIPPIYNFVSSSTNPLTWGEFSGLNKKHGDSVPTTKAVSANWTVRTPNGGVRERVDEDTVLRPRDSFVF